MPFHVYKYIIKFYVFWWQGHGWGMSGRWEKAISIMPPFPFPTLQPSYMTLHTSSHFSTFLCLYAVSGHHLPSFYQLLILHLPVASTWLKNAWEMRYSHVFVSWNYRLSSSVPITPAGTLHRLIFNQFSLSLRGFGRWFLAQDSVFKSGIPSCGFHR